MLTLREVRYRYPSAQAPAVGPISVAVPRGQLVLLTGPTGCGKSTLLRLVAGLRQGRGERGGEIAVEGADPAGWSPRERVRRVGFVSQDPGDQIVAATLGEEVAFGLESAGVDPGELRLRVEVALRSLGLPVEPERPVRALSGGQLQRLVVAGALAAGAGLLVLDEPLAWLDPAGALQLLERLRGLADAGVTVLLVEHRLELCWPVVDRVLVMDRGGLVGDAAPGGMALDLLRGLGLSVPGMRDLEERLERAGWGDGDASADELNSPQTPPPHRGGGARRAEGGGGGAFPPPLASPAPPPLGGGGVSGDGPFLLPAHVEGGGGSGPPPLASPAPPPLGGGGVSGDGPLVLESQVAEGATPERLASLPTPPPHRGGGARRAEGGAYPDQSDSPQPPPPPRGGGARRAEGGAPPDKLASLPTPPPHRGGGARRAEGGATPDQSPPPLATICDLLVTYGPLTALHIPQLTLHPGERVAVLGANGSGKSTLLGALARHPQVTRAGRALDVPQEPDLSLFNRTVAAELAYGPEEARLPPAEIQARVQAAARGLSVLDLLPRPPQALSRGQRLRVAVAAALTCRPDLLLLDEPTSGQDHDQVEAMMTALSSALGEATLVYATHDVGLAARHATRWIVLDAGRIVLDAPPVEAIDRLPPALVVPPLLAWCRAHGLPPMTAEEVVACLA